MTPKKPGADPEIARARQIAMDMRAAIERMDDAIDRFERRMTEIKAAPATIPGWALGHELHWDGAHLWIMDSRSRTRLSLALLDDQLDALERLRELAERAGVEVFDG